MKNGTGEKQNGEAEVGVWMTIWSVWGEISGVMAVLCLPSLFKGKVMRWQGILLLCLYVAFNVYQFVF